jgi:2-dehydro-3-deoxygluconokinase
MEKVLSFGDILLRLSPDTDGKWIDDHALPVYIGGAELNVANALAKWNVPVAYCSAAPDNYLTASILKKLRSNGIDTSRMISSGERIGIYYLAQGTDLKNVGVIYDRTHSSTSMLQRGDVKWDEVLEGVSWFHFSAISPAITENLALVCEEGLEAARKKNITVSVDLNYRAKLWKWGKHPVDVMPGLVRYCDVIMGNIWAIQNMLGITIEEGLSTDKQSCLTQSERSSRAVMQRYPLCRQVANTFRFDEGKGIRYYSTLCTKAAFTVSREYYAENIIDKVGSGDCFMAGLIYGSVNAMSDQQTLEFATAAAVDKMYVKGDATTSGADTINQRIK